MLSRVRDATGVMLRRRFREFDEDADPRRPAARRPLAGASALTAARELVPPDSMVGLILPIAHLWLNEPERVTIACSRHARRYTSLATSKRSAGWDFATATTEHQDALGHSQTAPTCPGALKN